MSYTQGGCCMFCCSFVFTSCLTWLNLWLSLRGDNPKCSITNFYLPALNSTLNEFNKSTNSTLSFTLKLKNPNHHMGINYEDVKVNITVFDRGGAPQFLGDYTVSHFYQGHKKTAFKQGQLNNTKTVVSQGISDNGTVEFRLDMVTQVRFKILYGRTKRHKIRVGANFTVNDKGTQVNPPKKKDVPLRSMAPKQGCCNLVMGILVNFVVLKFTSFW